MKNVDCQYRSKDNKAPTESEVDQMIRAIESHAEAKGYGRPIAERQYWYWRPTYDEY